MTMPRFKQVKYWSIIRGCDVIRVMGAGLDGREYFVEIEDGAGWRDRREMALEAIGAAIDRGDEPGQIDVMGLWPAYPPPPPKPQGRAPDASESIRYEPAP